MQQVVIAGLVGAGVGYLVRFGQEQIPQVVRGLARNELVAGTARRGRDVVQAGVKGGVQMAQAGVKGGVDVAQAGARGGLEVARAAAGRPTGTVRPTATGRSRPGRAVRVPVGKNAPTTRRGAGRASEQASAPKGGRSGASSRRASQRQPLAPLGELRRSRIISEAGLRKTKALGITSSTRLDSDSRIPAVTAIPPPATALTTALH